MTRNKKRPIVTSFTTSKKVSDSRKSKQMIGANPYFKVGHIYCVCALKYFKLATYRVENVSQDIFVY